MKVTRCSKANNSKNVKYAFLLRLSFRFNKKTRAVEAHFNIFDGFEGALQTFNHDRREKMASETDSCPSALASKIIASLEKEL